MAFISLGRERRRENLSLGMAGSLPLPLPLPGELIRGEGRRLGYSGADHSDFVQIIAAVDDFFVEVSTKRIADETATRARQQHNRGR